MIDKLQIEDESTKNKKLLLGILLDLVGMLSFSVPVVGEFSDVVWAPIATYIMIRMYKGNVGRVAGTIAFLEEIVPFTDAIPAFTLTWIYTYLIKKKRLQ